MSLKKIGTLLDIQKNIQIQKNKTATVTVYVFNAKIVV